MCCRVVRGIVRWLGGWRGRVVPDIVVGIAFYRFFRGPFATARPPVQCGRTASIEDHQQLCIVLFVYQFNCERKFNCWIFDSWVFSASVVAALVGGLSDGLGVDEGVWCQVVCLALPFPSFRGPFAAERPSAHVVAPRRKKFSSCESWTLNRRAAVFTSEKIYVLNCIVLFRFSQLKMGFWPRNIFWQKEKLNDWFCAYSVDSYSLLIKKAKSL